MQVSTELKSMFSFSVFPILVILIIILILFIIHLIINRKKKIIIPKVKLPEKKNQLEIKQKYLKDLDQLLTNFNTHQITNRQAFQSLSLLVRHFIYEMTSIRVQNCTLSDISKLNMPILYELVLEYYDPEFSKISSGNIFLSIEKTRKVIEKWN